MVGFSLFLFFLGEREGEFTVAGLGIDKTGLHTCQLLTSEADKKYKNSTKITTKTTAKNRTNKLHSCGFFCLF